MYPSFDKHTTNLVFLSVLLREQVEPAILAEVLVEGDCVSDAQPIRDDEAERVAQE